MRLWHQRLILGGALGVLHFFSLSGPAWSVTESIRTSVEARAEALFLNGDRMGGVKLLHEELNGKTGSYAAELRTKGRNMARAFRTLTTLQLSHDAHQLLIDGRYKAAREKLEAAKREEPDNVEVLFYLALAFIQEGDVKPSRAIIEQVASVLDDDPDVLSWKGRVLFLLGDLSEAVTYLKRAVLMLQNDSADPALETAVLWLVEAQLSLGQRPAALQILDRDTAQNPSHFEALCVLMRLRLSSGVNTGGLGKDMAALWDAQRELQVVRSRLKSWQELRASEKPRKGSLYLDVRKSVQEIEGMVDRLETQLNGKLEEYRSRV